MQTIVCTAPRHYRSLPELCSLIEASSQEPARQYLLLQVRALGASAGSHRLQPFFICRTPADYRLKPLGGLSESASCPPQTTPKHSPTSPTPTLSPHPLTHHNAPLRNAPGTSGGAHVIGSARGSTGAAPAATHRGHQRRRGRGGSGAGCGWSGRRWVGCAVSCFFGVGWGGVGLGWGVGVERGDRACCSYNLALRVGHCIPTLCVQNRSKWNRTLNLVALDQ